jgi:hypothetical protein
MEFPRFSGSFALLVPFGNSRIKFENLTTKKGNIKHHAGTRMLFTIVAWFPNYGSGWLINGGSESPFSLFRE